MGCMTFSNTFVEEVVGMSSLRPQPCQPCLASLTSAVLRAAHAHVIVLAQAAMRAQVAGQASCEC